MRRSFNPLEKFILADRSNWKCSICGCDLPKDWHADHIRPVSKGGHTWLANGQALCPTCNLKKGDVMDSITHQTKILRPWQTECFDVHRSLRKDDPNKKDYLYQATPGAGKTRLAIELLTYERDRAERQPFIVIVSPSKGLTVQWADEIANYDFLVTENYSANKPDVDGWSITYQALMNPGQVSKLQDILRERHTIIVFDEIHHLSDRNMWGLNSGLAFSGAKLRIGLTGTPFRSDGEKILFVTYDAENGFCVPDYKLDYAKALSYADEDKMVRSISFPYFEGFMSWVNEEGPQEADFNADLNNKEDRERLRTALNPYKGYFQEMWSHADAKLNEIRLNQFSKAGGLIFCIDQKHARQVSTFIEQQTGKYPSLVISSEEDSVEKLDNFKKSSDKWLVSVGMVTEGVDIPRAIVGVYATNVTTMNRFWQSVFRIGRYINDGVTDNSVAHMYLPKHRTFIEYAENILKEIENYVDSIEKSTLPETDGILWNDAEKTQPSSVYFALSSNGSYAGHVFDGDHYSPDELEQATILKSMDPGIANWDVSQLAKTLAAAKKLFTSTNLPAIKTTKQSYDKRENKLREEACNLVDIIAGRVSRRYSKEKGKCIVGINAFLKNRFGAREGLALDKLTELQNLLLDKLNDTSWWKANIYVE